MEENILQAHGITQAEMRDTHRQQTENNEEFITANNVENLTDKFFIEEYGAHKIRNVDRNCFHLAQETRLFDQASGQKLSKSSVLIESPEQYHRLKESDTFLGRTIEILHDPRLKAEEPKSEPAPKQEAPKQGGDDV